MPSSLTIVIPALNEAERLPVLLGALSAQTQPPDAIVVADAGSTDGTRELAETAGAIVVEGGKPAAGRNAGATIATTDLILFLDADVEPGPDWIELAVAEFEQRQLSAAGGQVEPVERDAGNVFACDVVNLYLQLMQYLVPHAPGFCILVCRDVHEQIGGFDETVLLAEDHEYVQRAAQVGKFRILRDTPPMPTSMRRIEKEGLVSLSFKYLYSELYVVTGRPVKEMPFEYEFAAFDRDKNETRALAEKMRDRLRALGEPIERLSARALERLRLLGETGIPHEAVEKLLRDLTPDEVHELHDYLTARAEYMKRPQSSRRSSGTP